MAEITGIQIKKNNFRLLLSWIKKDKNITPNVAHIVGIAGVTDKNGISKIEKVAWFHLWFFNKSL